MTQVFGYNKFTKTGKLLAKTMGAQFNFPRSDKGCKEGEVVINWGAGYGYPFWGDRAGKWINKPKAVAVSVNKIHTFKALAAAGMSKYIPEFTRDHAQASAWIHNGIVVVARKEEEENQGKGIIVFDLINRTKVFVDPENGKSLKLMRAPTAEELDNEGFQFYTKFFKKKWELKVHVAFGKAWLWWRVEKDKEGYYEHGKYIFNYAEGYKFTRCRTDIHPEIKRVCEEAIKAVGLDFGVVDIGVGENLGEMCIFETNTAPTLDEYDARQYAEMFYRELKLK